MRSIAIVRGASAVALMLANACGGSNASETGPSRAGSPGTANAGAANAGGPTLGAAGTLSAGNAAGGGAAGVGEPSGPGAPQIAGCAMLPANHLFNTELVGLPAHASSAEFMNAVGTHRIHLDLGTSIDPKSTEYYGIPYNVVHSKQLAWQDAHFRSTDGDLDWDPTQEADCAAGDTHRLVSPCTKSAAPAPQFPIPVTPLVEGGIVTDPSQPYGDHHILLLDADTCSDWELYHAYPDAKGGWDIFGAAFFDLNSNKLRPAGWTSADAAGFPILPLLLRADEASSGKIAHALRFTIDSKQIRAEYTWPARHLTNSNASLSLPPMGQAFRIKASYVIPTSFNTQSKAILQALKTYGMYLADGGSSLYIQGEPSEKWQSDTFDQVQSVSSSEFEAVNLEPIQQRAGFDADSAAVPP